MRISLWPALVCGSMLAAMIGNTVRAAPPADQDSGAVTQADAVDDSESVEDSADAAEALGSFNPYQPIQYAPAEPAYPPDGAGYAPGPVGFDPTMNAPNAWPQVSPK